MLPAFLEDPAMPSSLGFYIGNFFIAYYGLAILTGLIIAVLVGWYQTHRHNLVFNDLIIILSVCALGGILGAKLLYLIVSWRQIQFERLLDLDYLNALMRGGFVFYGGLLGGLTGLLFCRRVVNIQPYVRAAIPCVPLAHGFGRIGCTLVGCCYGTPYDGPFAICYSSSLFAPNHISLFPVQAVEAVLLLLIAGILLLYINRHKGQNSLRLYLLLYAPVRFILEFFRYDAERGIVLGFSISQWISLALIGVVLTLWLLEHKRQAPVI